MKKHRILALILCIVLCIVFCSSLAFIAFHVEHDCCGTGCEICNELQNCRIVISAIGTGIILSAIAVFLLSEAKSSDKRLSTNTFVFNTLISLKVKLSY